MNANALIQLSVLLLVLTLLSEPLGVYIYRMMESGLGGPRRLWPLEHSLYRCCRVDAGVEMNWKTYAAGLLAFNLAGTLLLYLLQRWQAPLPLNPAHLGGVAVDSAFNTAVSFASNTSWQSYVPETTLGNCVQMVGLSSQSLLSAATGIAALMALLRGLARSTAATIGNAWVDLTRCTLYLLLPLSALPALVLVWQGVIQNLHPDRVADLLRGAGATRTLPMGPVASQTAVALLSGDGGGFFNANSAHPFANPTGSAFAGIGADTPFYNLTTAAAMWLGRYVPLLAVLAMAGSLAAKRRRAAGPGTLPTHGPLFLGLLPGTVLVVGALTFLPALALGPIAQQLQYSR
jgi:K+-transporting ATPase ATPase A chain